MTRIFLILALADTIFLAMSTLLGTVAKLGYPDQPALSEAAWYHFLFGLSGAILTILVHCAIFTYFLGTGRWVKEVKYAYKLPDAPLPLLTRELKRIVFPPALYAMLSAIATGALGAATHVQLVPWQLHAIMAGLTLVINLWAFLIEYRCLETNAGVLEEVMREVDRRRLLQGLPPNAEALLEDGP